MLSAYMALIDDAGQRAQFERFYYDSRNAAMRIALAVLHNSSIAEEAVSESFMKLAKCFQNVHNLSSHDLESYFVIIVRNTSINMLRTETRIDEVRFDDALDYNDLPDADAQRLNECVALLPENDQELLFMRFTLCLGYREIAQALSISEEAARQRVRYVKGKLKRLLEEKEHE